MSDFVLHLLRHGLCETPGLMLGHSDAAPTPAGIAACAARVADLAFDGVVASDLTRAASAAEAIAATRNLPVTRDARWRELDFGDWDGRASAELDRDAFAAFWDDPDANPPPGGERWSALTARVAAALADLPARETLVVTHGGAMRAAVAVLCGLDHRQGWAVDLPCAALLSLRIWPGQNPAAQIVGLRT
jgi:alpha-ribazole phosphatase